MIVYYGMVRRGGVYNSGNDDYRRHYLHNYHHCIDEFPLRVHNLKTPMDNQTKRNFFTDDLQIYVCG